MNINEATTKGDSFLPSGFWSMQKMTNSEVATMAAGSTALCFGQVWQLHNNLDCD